MHCDAVQVADVSSFLAVRADQLSADPITALRAINALAQSAVQKVEDLDNLCLPTASSGLYMEGTTRVEG